MLMILWHVTPGSRAPAILTLGLMPLCSEGRLPCVWLATTSRLGWALIHVSEHHGLQPWQLRILVVGVPREWLIRRRGGIYTCDRHIPSYRVAELGFFRA